MTQACLLERCAKHKFASVKCVYNFSSSDVAHRTFCASREEKGQHEKEKNFLSESGGIASLPGHRPRLDATSSPPPSLTADTANMSRLRMMLLLFILLVSCVFRRSHPFCYIQQAVRCYPMFNLLYCQAVFFSLSLYSFAVAVLFLFYFIS